MCQKASLLGRTNNWPSLRCVNFAAVAQTLLLWAPEKKNPDIQCQWHPLICMATSKNMSSRLVTSRSLAPHLEIGKNRLSIRNWAKLKCLPAREHTLLHSPPPPPNKILLSFTCQREIAFLYWIRISCLYRETPDGVKDGVSYLCQPKHGRAEEDTVRVTAWENFSGLAEVV